MTSRIIFLSTNFSFLKSIFQLSPKWGQLTANEMQRMVYKLNTLDSRQREEVKTQCTARPYISRNA